MSLKFSEVLLLHLQVGSLSVERHTVILAEKELFPFSDWKSQNHTELQNGRGWKGPLWVT